MAQGILFELEDLFASMMTYLIANFVLTTKTAGVVRGKKKGMEEEAKQETYYEGSKIYKKNIE